MAWRGAVRRFTLEWACASKPEPPPYPTPLQDRDYRPACGLHRDGTRKTYGNACAADSAPDASLPCTVWPSQTIAGSRPAIVVAHSYATRGSAFA